MNDKDLKLEGRRVLRDYLAESGISAREAKVHPRKGDFSPDAEIDIQLPNGSRRHLLVEFKANPRRVPAEAALARLRGLIAQSSSSDLQPMLFSSYFGRPMREWLRNQGIWFADLSGNRFFSGPGLLIHREVAAKPAEAREQAPSIFADRNSLILRYLVPRPALAIGVRDLARHLQVSPAAVSLALRSLREMGFLRKDGSEIRLLDRESLLEEWVSFYRSRFRKQPESRYYVRVRDAEAIVKRMSSSPVSNAGGYGLSLHAGASLVAPYVQFREVHVYVGPGHDRLRSRLVSALKAQEAQADANFVILEPFYKNSFLFGSRLIRGVRVVSDVQLYLDLSCFPQRGLEQAQVILERRLRPSWATK